MNKPTDNIVIVDKCKHASGGDGLAHLRSEFAANVSHELKTPLTSIKGFADLLSSGVVTDEVDRQRFITMISVEADRMIHLINDIMHLSELQAEEMHTSPCLAEVMSIASDVIASLQYTAAKASVTLDVSGDACYLKIEPERLRILFVNLIENAIKYNKPGGKVTVTIRDLGAAVSISVSDTGIGIAPEYQARVFERFYRVDKSRSKKTGGTGLGLAIVKHIVALNGGYLSLSSAPGEGTTVTMEFDCTSGK